MSKTVEELRERCARHLATIEQHRERIEGLKVRIEAVRARDMARKEQVERLQQRQVSPLIWQQMQIADGALDALVDTLTPDTTVFARGIEALPAAVTLAEKSGGRLICDVLEVRDYTQRIANRNAPPAARLLVEAAHTQFLQRCDHILTVSSTIAMEIKAALDRTPYIQPQWHTANAHRNDPEIAARLKSFAHVVTINCLQNEIGPLLPALEGFTAAVRSGQASNTVCVIAGRIMPAPFFERVIAYIEENGLTDRILFLNQLDADGYGTVLSATTLGLVTLDPEIGNHRASFPNRVVDFAAFGIPICMPELPDVMAESKLRGYLNIISDVRNPQAWQAAIASGIANPHRLPPLLTDTQWDVEFVNEIGSPRKLLMIDNSLRWHGNRVKRQILALLQNECTVQYFSRNWKIVDGIRSMNLDNPFVLDTFHTIEDFPYRPAWSGDVPLT